MEELGIKGSWDPVQRLDIWPEGFQTQFTHLDGETPKLACFGDRGLRRPATHCRPLPGGPA